METNKKYPFLISELKHENGLFSQAMKKDEADIVINILRNLKGHSLIGALKILDDAKRVVIECTQINSEYEY